MPLAQQAISIFSLGKKDIMYTQNHVRRLFYTSFEKTENQVEVLWDIKGNICISSSFCGTFIKSHLSMQIELLLRKSGNNETKDEY